MGGVKTHRYPGDTCLGPEVFLAQRFYFTFSVLRSCEVAEFVLLIDKKKISKFKKIKLQLALC